MRVERITVDNLSDVAEIGHAFTKEVAHPGGFNFRAFAFQWVAMLQSGVGEIFVVRDGERVAGILGAAFVPEGFSGWMTALEQFWYVLPEYRKSTRALRLLNAFEAEAKARKCRKILLVHLANSQSERLEELYRNRGYVLIEKTYGKLI